jgi:hypothetical protein
MSKEKSNEESGLDRRNFLKGAGIPQSAAQAAPGHAAL